MIKDLGSRLGPEGLIMCQNHPDEFAVACLPLYILPPSEIFHCPYCSNWKHTEQDLRRIYMSNTTTGLCVRCTHRLVQTGIFWHGRWQDIPLHFIIQRVIAHVDPAPPIVLAGVLSTLPLNSHPVFALKLPLKRSMFLHSVCRGKLQNYSIHRVIESYRTHVPITPSNP